MAARQRAPALAIAAMGSKSRTDLAAAGEEHPRLRSRGLPAVGEEQTHWQLQPWE